MRKFKRPVLPGEDRNEVEANVKEDIIRFLKYDGWKVVDFSQRRGVEGGLEGWVDLEAFKLNHTLLLETKSRTGRAREKQLKLEADLRPHLGPNVHYMRPRSVEPVIDLVNKLRAEMGGR